TGDLPAAGRHQRGVLLRRGAVAGGGILRKRRAADQRAVGRAQHRRLHRDRAADRQGGPQAAAVDGVGRHGGHAGPGDLRLRHRRGRRGRQAAAHRFDGPAGAGRGQCLRGVLQHVLGPGDVGDAGRDVPQPDPRLGPGGSGTGAVDGELPDHLDVPDAAGRHGAGRRLRDLHGDGGAVGVLRVQVRVRDQGSRAGADGRLSAFLPPPEGGGRCPPTGRRVIGWANAGAGKRNAVHRVRGQGRRHGQGGMTRSRGRRWARRRGAAALELAMQVSGPDIGIVLAYLAGVFVLAQWVSREKAGHAKDADDYFLASKSLPWWAIGASLIAANISAEQIIGMSGSGFAIGLAIASYEWMAAATLLIVGKWFLPVFLRNRIYTMPQFLERRYGSRLRTVMAVFWLGLYVFVNLTSILWLGSLAIAHVAGIDQMAALLALAVFALAFQLYGGLKAVALTDIVQVVLLVAGGLLLAGISLDRIGEGAGIWAGFQRLRLEVPGHFHMILSPENPFYKDLPGVSVLVGGMWIMNLSYWGFNQYIIQRALAAKDLAEAQKGVLFAAFLKLLMPVIVVVPGLAAVLLAPDIARPDAAY